MRHPNGAPPLREGWSADYSPCIRRSAGCRQSRSGSFGILARADRGIEVDHARRVLAAPRLGHRAPVPRDIRFWSSRARVQHRGRGFIHEQLVGRFRCSARRSTTGFRWNAALPDPIGQHRAVQIKPARARIWLWRYNGRWSAYLLTSTWAMVASVGRPPMIRCGVRRLGHPVGAGPAGVFGAHGDDHAQLGRHDVQPLAAVLADLVHEPAATRAATFCSFPTERR